MIQTSPLLDQAVFTDMPMHSLISVKGPDAEKLLQGQCTCDIKSADNNKVLLGAHCNAKGRALSSFVLVKISKDEYYLRVRKDIAQDTLAALQKYSVFFKVTLSEAGQQLIAVLGSAPLDLPETGFQQILDDTTTLINHGNGFVEIWAPAEGPSKLIATIRSTYKEVPASALEHLLIERGIAEIQQITQGEFIPQDLNYQFTGAISFNKGCYTGQEIVARMQYRGQLKKHCYHAVIDDCDVSNCAPVGAKITDMNDTTKALGTIVASSASFTINDIKTPIHALVVTTEAIATSDIPLSVANSKAKISWLSLPYAIT